MSPHKVRREAIKYGYRSGLEHAISIYLTELKCEYGYESLKIEGEDLTYRTYTPDFILNNGIIIETKGEFKLADKKKHVSIKLQHPDLDIRFVFSNSKTKIYKNAKSNYADWCTKKGFTFSDKCIPEDWLKEKKKKTKIDSFIAYKGTKKE